MTISSADTYAVVTAGKVDAMMSSPEFRVPKPGPAGLRDAENAPQLTRRQCRRYLQGRGRLFERRRLEKNSPDREAAR